MTGRPHRASFRFPYASPSVARTVERSLSREVGTIEGDRSATRVDREGATVTVVVEADDPRALRAAKNTWFSLVAVAERTVDAAE